MRRLLESDPELVAWIHSGTGWLWLMVALYGGLGHVQLSRATGSTPTRTSKQDAAVACHYPAEETAASERGLSSLPIVFSPRDMVHDLADADLSRQIQQPPQRLASLLGN